MSSTAWGGNRDTSLIDTGGLAAGTAAYMADGPAWGMHVQLGSKICYIVSHHAKGGHRVSTH